SLAPFLGARFSACEFPLLRVLPREYYGRGGAPGRAAECIIHRGGACKREGRTMSFVAIRAEESVPGEPLFRAIAGNRQSLGRTMGEALDALTADWGDEVQETAVLIHRFRPDAYF